MPEKHGALPTTCREAIEGIPAIFKGENAAGIEAVIQFNITGQEPGNWYLTIKEQKCTCTEGMAEGPDLTIEAPSDVWLAISRGELKGPEPFMSGKAKARGDMSLLMQMGKFF